MSDEKTEEELSAEAQAASNAEWQGKIDALTADNERLTAKINESNKHTKAAEAKAAAEERDRLKSENDFESLFKSSEVEREALKKQIETRDSEAATANEKNAAMNLANELTTDTKRAKILAKELKGRLKYIDGEIKVTDLNGGLTVSTTADLKMEVQKNPDYDFLIDGVDSSGGSATGGSSNGSAKNTMTRGDFESMSPEKKMAFIKNGGKTTD